MNLLSRIGEDYGQYPPSLLLFVFGGGWRASKEPLAAGPLGAEEMPLRKRFNLHAKAWRVLLLTWGLLCSTCPMFRRAVVRGYVASWGARHALQYEQRNMRVGPLNL